MTNMSADEALTASIKEFGAENGPIILNVTSKVANLALRWRMFLYLFCGPQERVGVLNEASGITTKILSGLLWDDALMRVRQMTDPAKSSNNDNLSLEHLVRIATATRDKDISDMYKSTLDACKPARRFATKHLAHLDLNCAVGDTDLWVTRGQTTDAIRAICLFVQEFHAQVRGVTHFLMPIMSAADDQQFLLRLHLGNRAAKSAEAALLAAFRTGASVVPEPADAPDWIWERRQPADLF